MSTNKKRIFMCGMHQESNSFNPVPSPISMFDIIDGCNVKETTVKQSTFSSGMVSYLESADDFEKIYSTVMRAAKLLVEHLRGNKAKTAYVTVPMIAPELFTPVEVKNARVRSLHNGYFTLHGPISRGKVSYCGKVAVLEVGKILIQISENGRSEGDRGYYRGFGIEPEFCDLVSVKACTSFRAGYEPIAAEICNTATPGAAGTVLTELPYKKRPVPLYPFEEISESDISDVKVYR